MAEAPSDRPAQWDTERYVLDNSNDPKTNDEVVRVGHLFGQPVLAQELYDKGLIFLLNQNVLHHYGYAVGVTTRTVEEDGAERAVVDGLCIFKSDDPEGVWFDEGMIVLGRKKLKAAGLR